MSYVVLARKCRPQKFEDVIGQKHITQTLKNAIINKRVAHAFLFTGVRGVGKTSVARILAKTLNCAKQGDNPCNECQSCHEITVGNSVDVLEIDGASNTGIDDVRAIKENIKYLPSKGKYKIYIIDEVHMLSISAFNALLKTLEEPPKHIIFIFATTEPQKIPLTVLSRCQRLDFKRIPYKQIAEHLQNIVSLEGIKISPQSLITISKLADGSLRDALSLLDQVISYGGKEISDEEVNEFLGIIDKKLLNDILTAILRHDTSSALTALDKAYQSGYDIKEIASSLLELIRHLIVLKIVPSPSKLIDLSDSYIEELTNLSKEISLETLQQLFDILFSGNEDIIRSTFPKMILETLIIKMATLRPIISIDKILEKLSLLEKRLKIGYIPSLEPTTLPSGTIQTETKYKPDQQNKGEKKTKIFEEISLSEIEEVEDQETKNSLYLKMIVQYIQDKKPTIASILEENCIANVEQTYIELGLLNKNFLRYLKDSETISFLSEVCSKLFKREMRVIVKTISSDNPSLTLQQIEEERLKIEKEKLYNQAKEHPIIKSILTYLGGKLIDVTKEEKKG